MNKLLLCAALVLTSAAAHAASFDCTHGGSANEKLICSDPELSAMDDRLAKVFRQARARAENKRAFRTQSDVQWQWREQNCHDRACLVEWYGRRQQELQALAEGSMSMAAKLPAKPAAEIAVAAAPVTAPAPVSRRLSARAPIAAPKLTWVSFDLSSAAVPAASTAARLPNVANVPQAMASSPPAAAALKLSLDSSQIAGVAPAGSTPWPHYVRVDNGEYFYEDPEHGKSLVTVRYYGMAHGQYIVEAVRGKDVLRYTCSAECAYIGQLALPGDEEKDMVILPNDRTSLPALIVGDAINGLLAETHAR